jgi:hypothetical protein
MLSDGNLDNSRGGGIVITGCGCSPIGILLSVVLSAIGTLLANLLLRRRP